MRATISTNWQVIGVSFFLAVGTGAPTVRAQVSLVGTGESDIVTNLPGTFNAGTNVNNLIGANRFYNAGIRGQGTITANVEAGLIWNGHETLGHVSNYSYHSDAFGSTTAELFDRHATWVGSHIGGRGTNGYQMGIAPDTDLRSGAIATAWSGSAYATGFGFNLNSFKGGYQPFFGTADVINSSWGGTSPAGNNPYAIALDGWAAQYSNTTFVVSAGNSGPNPNTVGWPGSGYNAITVGALDNGGNNSYSSIASFSSRGPQDFYNAATNTVIQGVRAAVDIAAPGTNLTAAYYGGQTGGNNTGLVGSASSGGPTSYSTSVNGTSFASPIVAGGVALIKSASYNNVELAANAASRDTLVVKSVLMNSADRITGWNNGQVAHSNGLGGVKTTQALDWVSGAGKINLDEAFDQYLMAGTRDVSGLGSGDLGAVSSVGWDLGNVDIGGSNLYRIGGLLEANSTFNVSLNWFRDRLFNTTNNTVSDIAQADLTLRVIDLTTSSVISESLSLYNTSELLSFVLPRTSQYGIEVVYGGTTFGSDLDVNYGLAWSGTAHVPDYGSSLGCVSVGLLLLGAIKRRQR
jgi:subtilisin family serine protease